MLTELFWITLTLGGCILVLGLPAIPPGWILFGAVIGRTLSDVGAATTGSLLPSSLLSTGLGMLLIVAALLPSKDRLSDAQKTVIAVILVLLSFSVLVYIARFASIVDALSEPVRVASLLAVFVLSRRYALTQPERSLRMLGVVSIPAAILLLVGAVSGVSIFLSSGERAVGTFSHPNSAAAFFSMTALVGVGVAITKKDKGWWLLAAMSLGALLMTQSLGGLLSWVVGVVVFVLLRSEITALKKASLLVLLTAASVAVSLFSNISTRLEELSDLDISGSLSTGQSTNSLEWRLINWTAYLDIFATAPLLGTGSGSTYGEIMPLGGPPHSLFIEFLVEYGLLGAGTFLVLLILAVIYLVRRLASGWTPGLILALICLMIVNGSESNLFGYTAAMYYAALAIGVLVTNLPSLSTSDSKGTQILNNRKEKL